VVDRLREAGFSVAVSRLDEGTLSSPPGGVLGDFVAVLDRSTVSAPSLKVALLPSDPVWIRDLDICSIDTFQLSSEKLRYPIFFSENSVRFKL